MKPFYFSTIAKPSVVPYKHFILIYPSFLEHDSVFDVLDAPNNFHPYSLDFVYFANCVNNFFENDIKDYYYGLLVFYPIYNFCFRQLWIPDILEKDVGKILQIVGRDNIEQR